MNKLQTNDKNGVHERKSNTDENLVSEADISYLNKILNQKLNLLNEGIVEVSKQQCDPNSPLYSVQTFESLRMQFQNNEFSKRPLIEALYLMGFHQPSKIQEAALPVLLCEPPQDIIAQSQSGTGKTATFLLAMLNRVDPEKKYPQCICLAPTYELARQIGEVAQKMSRFLDGVSIRYGVKGEKVDRSTSFAEQIVIGTPGKMLDWLVKSRLIDARNIIAFVLDEADVMISEEGYQTTSIQIHNEIISSNPNCQCMLFSATYSDAVFQFAEKLIADPVIITFYWLKFSIRRQDQSLPYIRQYYVKCKDREAKFKASSASWLAEKLRAGDRDVGLLHGDLSVEERAKVATEFRDGYFKVLITTNVSARGLDMPQVSLVVNYDPPVTFGDDPKPDFDTYLHRIGRTGRFGKPGIAINLVDSEYAMSIVRKFEEYFVLHKMKHGDDIVVGDDIDGAVEPSSSGVVLDSGSNTSYHNHQQNSGPQSQQACASSGQQQWVLDDRMKRMLMDLQRHWLNDYQQSREKMLVEMTEKLHQEFLSDQQKIRTDLLTQFKEELDTTRNDLEQKYRESVRQETGKLADRFRREISANKKKQWCWQCEAEAIYHCCWNTAYCSVECQQQHWPQHRRNCRRKRNPAMGGNGANSNGTQNANSGGANA